MRDCATSARPLRLARQSRAQCHGLPAVPAAQRAARPSCRGRFRVRGAVSARLWRRAEVTRTWTRGGHGRRPDRFVTPIRDRPRPIPTIACWHQGPALAAQPQARPCIKRYYATSGQATAAGQPPSRATSTRLAPVAHHQASPCFPASARARASAARCSKEPQPARSRGRLRRTAESATGSGTRLARAVPVTTWPLAMPREVGSCAPPGQPRVTGPCRR